mmetsp:Transcript_25130/g.38142  ORF Transcript_25130/g.38142 Transcript_25130/m.38142 type:complete len:271 (+) Transcript_25130:188-1000(+)
MITKEELVFNKNTRNRVHDKMKATQIQHHEKIPPDVLAHLLSETNFTKREIIEFYKYAFGGNEVVSKQEFAKICFLKGIKNVDLVNRIYQIFDANADGQLTHVELIKGLNPLLRGTKRDVAGFFFDLYDVDGNDDLTSAEIVAVYSDMLISTGDNSIKGLTAKEKERIRQFVKDHRKRRTEATEVDNESDDSENGRNSDKSILDKETFIQAIVFMEEPDGGDRLWSWRTLYFVFLTAWLKWAQALHCQQWEPYQLESRSGSTQMMLVLER